MSTTKQAGGIDGKLDQKLFYEGAPFFNGFNSKDQSAVVQVHRTKLVQGELKAPVGDYVSGLEEVAQLYHAQKCAFQDVLMKEGFDICSEVRRDYPGRISVLTHHGTLIVLGKDDLAGRYIVMTRIHSPKLNHNNERGQVVEDLKIGIRPHLHTSRVPYRGSSVRALAMNSHGANGDELQTAVSLSEKIHSHTNVLFTKYKQKG